MNLTCYVVDDEKPAIMILNDYIKRTPGLELTGSTIKALEGLNEVTSKKPDLVFLDIDMPGLNGLDFAALTNDITTIIFTTSYREYGVEAYEASAGGYLLKPIAYEKFLSAVSKVRKFKIQIQPELSEQTAILIKSGTRNELLRLVIADISHIAGLANYVEIFMSGRKIVGYLTLGEIFEKLPSKNFLRIHKSYIVNDNYVQSVDYAQVKLKDGTALPIGRTYRNEFQDKIHGSILISKRG